MKMKLVNAALLGNALECFALEMAFMRNLSQEFDDKKSIRSRWNIISFSNNDMFFPSDPRRGKCKIAICLVGNKTSL